MTRGEELHQQLQAILLGERLVDCARAVTLSLAAVAGLYASTQDGADELINMLAGHAKQDVRANWEQFDLVRQQSAIMHGIDESGRQ